jgi:hypothetical protein
MEEKYGSIHALQNNDILIKAKESMIKKYGTDNINILPEIRDKIKQTNLERYGVEHLSQKHYDPDTLNKINDIEWIVEQNKTKSIQEIADELGIQHSTLYVRLRKHNITPIRHFDNTSKAQLEVYNYIQSIYSNLIEQNTRSIIPPLELDIWIPDKNIAIEYCGLYWHSELSGKDKKYHLNKMKLCNEKGIRLITIFEDEWINKQDICKERLKHILGISNTICYARQTSIREITNNEYINFINTYHIQGYVASPIKLGAWYNGDLIAVMAIGKRRKSMGTVSVSNSYELLRFASKGNIPGIASKLFTYFKKKYNPIEVTSYCDLRWGTGNLYKQIGFTYTHTSNPNYWYMKDYKKREYRFMYRKDILVKEGYDNTLTEFEIMKIKGYDRIWDCGNSVWIWNR